MKPEEYIILGLLDAAVVSWLAVSFVKFWDVVSAVRNDAYWKARTNLTNAGIALVIVVGINAIAL